ncbi:MAG: glutathione S-transferase family protein [Hyphomonadaceae bacterium]|nr:glutathione S-transferase family protein [Hyphomonadaceae bacterium]
MAGDLKFYTNPMSRGRIARWMLEEVGQPYETQFLRYGPEMNAPAYTAINPMAKVPVIVHGNTVVTECAAICAYLADVFPGAGLGPTDAERGKYYRAMFFAAGPLEQAVTNRSMGWATDDPQKSGMMGYGSFERAIDGLKSLLGDGPYICGDRFTAADVYVGSQIGWGLGFGTMPETPEFTGYRDRIYAREAFTRAKALDDAAMAEYGPNMPSGS